MTNPHRDAYGRALVTSAVHATNRDNFLRQAEAAKTDGNFEQYQSLLQQADRSNQLFEAMSIREAAAQEN